jgi:TrmH family RNA methyltransferase
VAPTAAIREIQSLDHPLVKEIRRALGRGEPLSRGDFAGTLALDSPHLVEEAVAANLAVDALLFVAEMEGAALRLFHRGRAPSALYRLSKEAFKKTASTESPQGLLALVRTHEWVAHELFSPAPALILILAGIQDPGNAGTLLRSAEAFGATGAILLRGAVQATHPKMLRAAAGSTFRLPHMGGVQQDQALAMCAVNGATVYALDPGARDTLDRVDLRGPCAFAVGAEGAGLPPDLLDNARPVAIPRTRRVESLNAAVAGALALYEAARQRQEIAEHGTI